MPLARHQFPLGVVAGSLELVLRAGTRLKRVATVLAIHWRWCGLDMRSASYYSVRLWLLRLGLYQLSRAKIQADDWIWIADHTMQLGERKCLILVGIRQSAWDAEDRVLAQEDVELIDLVPVTESNREVVFRQLQAAAAKTGVPRAIVSDDGPDLRGGIDRFRQAHPTTAWLYDIKHKTACLLKHALEGDASWQMFVEKVHRFKQRVSFTPLAALAPPQQRSKARCMNADVLVDWAKESLRLLDRPQAMRKAGLKVQRVEEKLGWLRKFAPQVRRWAEMLVVIVIERRGGRTGCRDHKYPVQSFHEWLWNRDGDVAAAERLATLVARSGSGISRDDLARTLRLPPRILDDLLRALVTTGQVVMLKVGGRTVYRTVG